MPPKAKQIGVVLAGCGVFDGNEIHEAVLTLLTLDRLGATAVCLAPNIRHTHVINHLTGVEAKDESRNVLTESARIARGKIRDITGVQADDLDALIFPGGFGVVKNLSDYALTGTACAVHPDVARLARAVHATGKPIGALCIAPVLLAALFGPEHPQLTIGTDAMTGADIEKFGAKHIPCQVTEVVIDPQKKIVTTPAYMLANRISEAAAGIEKLVAAVIQLI